MVSEYFADPENIHFFDMNKLVWHYLIIQKTLNFK